MKNISLQSIKWESVRSIFQIITTKDTVSRAEISELTDLSLVTVGKVADALLEMNIVCQAKEVKASAGRRAGLLSVEPNKFAVILDLTNRCFRGVILNLHLNLMEKLLFPSNPEVTYAENLQAFLAEMTRAILKNRSMNNCYGVGVAVPSTYDPLTDTVDSSKICELSTIRLRTLIERYFHGVPLFIDSNVNAAARSNMIQIPDYKQKNILYCFIGDNTVRGAFVVKGEVILGRGSHFCDFGSVRDAYGRSLSEKITCAQTVKDYARILALDMANTIRILAPHVIIIECALREVDNADGTEEAPPSLIESLKSLLIHEHEFTEETLPEFVETGCKGRHAHRGIAMKLRDMWIDQLILDT